MQKPGTDSLCNAADFSRFTGFECRPAKAKKREMLFLDPSIGCVSRISHLPRPHGRLLTF
jgi:hypothetical protein